MIGAEAKVLQRMTGDDCRESVFHSAQSVFVTISSESKPIFCNEEDKLFNLLPFASEWKKCSLSQYEVFCSHTRCCFGDVTQAERNSKHWFVVGGGLEITKASTDGASLWRAGRSWAESWAEWNWERILLSSDELLFCNSSFITNKSMQKKKTQTHTCIAAFVYCGVHIKSAQSSILQKV